MKFDSYHVLLSAKADKQEFPQLQTVIPYSGIVLISANS